jgi:hypothetical protein
MRPATGRGRIGAGRGTVARRAARRATARRATRGERGEKAAKAVNIDSLLEMVRRTRLTNWCLTPIQKMLLIPVALVRSSIPVLVII